MQATCPPFVTNHNFRWLSVKEGGGVWRLESLRQNELYFESDVIPDNQIRSFYDGHGKEWLTIHSRKLILPKFYRWNGNTPKKGYRVLGLFDLWLGTPDFNPGTIAASGFHDQLYQYSALKELPFTLQQSNDIYHQLSEAHGAPLDEIYNISLKICSSRCWGKTEPGAHCVTTYITA